MEDKVIVYVAGNPSAYPLEYYDADSQSYQGVIPQLLEQFSAESRYDVVYYQPGPVDCRERLVQNCQVDFASGYGEGDTPPAGTQVLPVFRTVYNGTEAAYHVCFTTSAPQELKTDLQTFFTSVSQEHISGILINSADVSATGIGLNLTCGALSLVFAAVIAVLALKLRKSRKKLKTAEHHLDFNQQTGLANIWYLYKHYPEITNDHNRVLYSLVYFYVDTDHLSRLGKFEETEMYLQYSASILQEYTAETDVLVQESDHGFVMLKRSGNLQEIDQWIAPIFERIRAYQSRDGKNFHVNISAGIYPLKAENRDVKEAISYACQGAYQAQFRHDDYVIYSDKMIQKLAEDKRLQTDIEQALEDQQFQLYIQFCVDAKSQRIVGGEALARWNHPQKGVLTPNHFIPLMEREGIISKLDYYCLRKTCAFLENLSRHNVETFFISCNFSRETFAAEDFVDQCKRIIDEYHFPTKLLIFELTESALERNLSQIKQNILDLKAYGISIAIDDFGDGFTSFYDLQHYPMDGIKLDKSLIDNITTKNGYSIVRAITQIGHELGIVTLAEGVESDDQVHALQKMDCDFIQGYRFHFPLPDWDATIKILEQFQPD